MRTPFALPRVAPLPCTLAFAALSGLVTALVLAAPAAAAPGPRAVPGEVVVRYAPGTGAAERGALRERVAARSARSLRVPRAQVLRVPDVPAALRALRRSPRVQIATPNMLRRAYDDDDEPSDPLLAEQWGLERIAAPAAWLRSVGEPGVVVAVVDSGVAAAHPDLAERIWTNPGEIAGNGIDDDGNGFTDDARGWDVIDHDGEPADDLEGHGTHVAGTIGATGDNATGITGVTWRTTIMPVRVLGDDGVGDTAGIAEGFEYAAANGARIVNASLGGEGDDLAQDPLTAAVIADHPEVLFVVAAGNGVEGGPGTDNDAVPRGEFPCNHTHPNLICVTATDRDDGRPEFANFGSVSVDLGAPGVDILSTVPGTRRLEEDFEAGLGAWTADGPWTIETDDEGAYVLVAGHGPGDLPTLTRSSPVSLAGMGGCRLVYDAFWSLEGDVVRVQRSLDGGTTWQTRATHAGVADWDVLEVALAADGEASVLVRFALEPGPPPGGNPEFGLDNLTIECAEGFDETSYAVFEGTSMATPHVAGAAALLAAADPSAGPLELRAALLDGGDPVSLLAGVTATGRRLNVAGALDRLDLPWPVTGDAVAITTTTARLTGTVDPRGSATGYQFEWGATPAYGNLAPAGEVFAGAGEDPVPAAADLAGLAPGATYHYRLVAIRGGARFPGEGRSFQTAVEPPEVVPEFGADAKVRCKARRARRSGDDGRRKRVARCRATATDAVRVKIVLKRRGRVVAKRSGRTGRYLKLRGKSVRRRRYTVVLKLRASDGRQAIVRRKRRI